MTRNTAESKLSLNDVNVGYGFVQSWAKPWIVVTPSGFQKVYPDEASALAASDEIPGSLASEAYAEDADHYDLTHNSGAEA